MPNSESKNHHELKPTRDEILDEIHELLELIEFMPADSDTQIRVSALGHKLKEKYEDIIYRERHCVDNQGRPFPHNQQNLNLKLEI